MLTVYFTRELHIIVVEKIAKKGEIVCVVQKMQFGNE